MVLNYPIIKPCVFKLKNFIIFIRTDKGQKSQMWRQKKYKKMQEVEKEEEMQKEENMAEMLKDV